jgi:C_GCAxxG_C_C family probable redox protein
MMISKDETLKIADTSAENGFLCSEAVLMAINASLGIENELIPKIATGFGAGVARSGELCGALSGGIIALGMVFGRSKDEGGLSGPDIYWFSGELVSRFRDKYGEVQCPKLLGLDLGIQEDYDEYRRLNMWGNQCRQYILEATGIVYDIIEKNKEKIGV